MTKDFKDFNEMMAKPIGDQTAATRRHIAIIGASGSGKTTWSCQAPETLIILTEPQAAGRIQETNPGARVVTIDDLELLPSCLEWLTTSVFSADSKWKPKTLVLDSVTEMCRLMADHIDGEKDTDWGFRQWKKYEDGCMRMMRRFRDLPVTLIGLFLDDISRGDDAGIGSRRLAVGKKSMSPKIAALFDLVFWTEVRDKGEDVTYALRTCGGVYRGYLLEQGKGHPALPKWVDAQDQKPIDVLKTIYAWRKENAKKEKK